MNSDFYSRYKVQLTFLSAIIVLAHLTIEYFQGGVVTHYFMQDGSLPGISNWWGLISLPALVWIVLSRIERRKRPYEQNSRNNIKVLYRLASSILFGIVVSYLFYIESSFLDYLMLGLFTLSLFIPLYFGEYLIGFTIGTMYVFGANIPLIGGCILLLLLLILYKLPRLIIKIVRTKT